MQYRQFPKLLVAALATLALSAGCGGGGGSPSIHPPTTLITEQNGDQWQYNLSGTATPTAGGAAQPITGTATASITSTTFNANPALALQIASNISVNGAAAVLITQTFYLQQDVNGNLIEVGQSFEDSSGTTTKTVTTPSLANSELFPGTFSNGETVAETINFTDTTTENYKLVVGSPTQESTPAGVFNTWPATVTLGGLAAGTQFWNPAIGMFVDGNIIANAELSTTNYKLDISYSLTSTNVTPA